MPDRTIGITLAQPGPDLHYVTLIHQGSGGDELALFASWAQEAASGTATLRGGSARDTWVLTAQSGVHYRAAPFVFDPQDGDTSITLSLGQGSGDQVSATLTAHPSGHATTVVLEQVPLSGIADHVVVIRVAGNPATGTPTLTADPDKTFINLSPGDRIWFSLVAEADVEWASDAVAYKDIDLDNPANAWLKAIPQEPGVLNGILRQVEPQEVRNQTAQDPGCGWNSGTLVLRSGLASDALMDVLDGDQLVLNYTVTVRSRSQPDKTHTWDPEVDINMPGVNE